MINLKIEVYLMCRDRIKYAIDCIKSIESQSFKNFKLIISDNSTSQKFSEVITNEFPHIELRQRIPSLSAVDHQNLILDEVRSDYFVVFHDDDLMMPDFLNTMMDYIQNYPQCSAIAPNALVIKNDVFTKIKFAKKLRHKMFLNNSEMVFSQYMNLKKSFHAPFPAYIYNKKYIKNIRYKTSEGGIYNDVSFLMKLADIAPILWVPETSIYYRDHKNAGRYVIDFKGKLSLARFVINFSLLNKNHDDILHFKLNTYIKYLIYSYKNLFKSKRTMRIKILLRFILSLFSKNPHYLYMLIKKN